MTGPAPSSGAGVSGFEIPLHRALTAPILLGGAPRSIAILNGTLAGALGLGLQQWIPGLLVWVIGHSLAVFAAKLLLGRRKPVQEKDAVAAPLPIAAE